ncbi:hypothetical protein Bca101_090439 [Brassica carinata]
MGKKKNPSTAEDPGSSSVKASRRSQRFSLQPSHALSQTLTEEPESLGKSARARRRSICQLKKRQPINQGQLQCLQDSTRETLNPTPPTLPANQRRAQTSTTLSCSKTKTALRIPEEYSIGSSSATNSTTETGENIGYLVNKLIFLATFMAYISYRTNMFILAATTKKARAMRMKLRATKTSDKAHIEMSYLIFTTPGIAKRLPRDADPLYYFRKIESSP